MRTRRYHQADRDLGYRLRIAGQDATPYRPLSGCGKGILNGRYGRIADQQRWAGCDRKLQEKKTS